MTESLPIQKPASTAPTELDSDSDLDLESIAPTELDTASDRNDEAPEPAATAPLIHVVDSDSDTPSEQALPMSVKPYKRWTNMKLRVRLCFEAQFRHTMRWPSTLLRLKQVGNNIWISS